MKTLIGGLIVLLFGASAGYGQSALEIGQKAPKFDLKSVSGEQVSTESLIEAGYKGAIVVFTCNHCPYSKMYEDRIIKLHKQFASVGYPVVAINSNDAVAYPSDSYQNMKKRSKKKDFPFEYLHDESQAIAKAYSAKRTPHIYVIEYAAEGGVVRYIGAIDNNAKSEASADVKYVENAVNDLVEGREVKEPSTKAVGCSIKWKK